jgi:hypothetical protein
MYLIDVVFSAIYFSITIIRIDFLEVAEPFPDYNTFRFCL